MDNNGHGDPEIVVLRILTYKGKRSWIAKCLLGSYVKGTFETVNGSISEKFLMTDGPLTKMLLDDRVGKGVV